MVDLSKNSSSKSKTPKVMIVADWHRYLYGEALYDTFCELGYDSSYFGWNKYFKGYPHGKVSKGFIEKILSFYYKAQNKYMVGPALSKMNKDLVTHCIKESPDLIFIYRGTHIYPETIKKIKEKVNCRVFGYHNDDPFSQNSSYLVNRFFLKSLPEYDWIFAFRQKNIDDYNVLGYQNVSLLRIYYIPKYNYYIEKNKKKYDVVFVGHWEDDDRDELIYYLLTNGINVQIFGTLWNKSKYYDYFLENMSEKIIPAFGAEYNQKINDGKIALAFLSKKNNDTYTTRNFEIPATKTLMLSEYTDDLASMFTPGLEADFFINKEELLRKIEDYLNNNLKLETVSKAGYRRLLIDGHSIQDRVKEIVNTYMDLLE